MILLGPLSGFIAARHYTTGLLPLIFCSCIGLAIGYGITYLSNRIAQRILQAESSSVAAQLIFYMLIPVFALTLSLLLPAGIVIAVYSK